MKKALEMRRRICKINVGTHLTATAFLINDSVIITNKHVVSNRTDPNDVDLIFNYEDTKEFDVIHCGVDPFSVRASENYDISLLKLKDRFGWIESLPEVVYGDPVLDDIISIIQHPLGHLKQICIGHNSLKYHNNEIIQYLTDTLPGSSGSPVFNSNWELIGLHSSGGNTTEPLSSKSVFRNEGIAISVIRDFLKENDIV